MNSDENIYKEATKAQNELLAQTLHLSDIDAIVSILYHMEGRYLTAKQCWDILISLHHFKKSIERFCWRIPGNHLEMFRLIISKGNGLFFKASTEEIDKVFKELTRLENIRYDHKKSI